jgi:hypothetical protein
MPLLLPSDSDVSELWSTDFSFSTAVDDEEKFLMELIAATSAKARRFFLLITKPF